MFNSKIIFALILPVVLSKSVQNRPVLEFDEEDLHLLRSAYDTPSYDHDSSGYDTEPDAAMNKIDLLKDGLWMLKAKLKELKAFDKALKATLLLDKLKLEEFLINHLSELKKHHHLDHNYVNKKPTYQVPSPPQYAPSQYAPQQYERPQYDRPASHHNQHDPYYGL